MANDLNLPAIADGQADGQWQTSNDGDAAVANALADLYTVDFTGGNVTLTASQFRSAYIFIGSNLSATRVLTLPAVKRPFWVYNPDATDSITVTKGSTTVPVGPGQLGVLYTDGTANGLVGRTFGSGFSGTIYDFGTSFGATPGAGDVIGRVRIGRAITIPANMSGSAGGVSINPDATFDIDVQDDGVSIGTISVSTGGIVTFTTTSGTSKSVGAGSEITFIAPSNSPAEASVEGGSFVILATVQ